MRRLVYESGIDGMQCGGSWRSPIAGLSGCIYALPAVLATVSPAERWYWAFQALVSIAADYVSIDRVSAVHGVDRLSAVFTFVVTAVRCLRIGLPLAAFGPLPLFVFVAANVAKSRGDFSAWCWLHFVWHLTGGCIIVLAACWMDGAHGGDPEAWSSPLHTGSCWPVDNCTPVGNCTFPHHLHP
jgi:hypothetical protein